MNHETQSQQIAARMNHDRQREATPSAAAVTLYTAAAAAALYCAAAFLFTL
jgi:hypothetical protein